MILLCSQKFTKNKIWRINLISLNLYNRFNKSKKAKTIAWLYFAKSNLNLSTSTIKKTHTKSFVLMTTFLTINIC